MPEPINHWIEQCKWEQDPLRARLEDVAPKPRNWHTFHWSTRLKLEGATYHWTIIRQVVSRPPGDEEEDNVLWRLLHWHIESFFFQLAGSVDMLLQEINAVYNLELDPKNVVWSSIQKVGNDRSVVKFLEKHWRKPCLRNANEYNNASKHRHYQGLASVGVHPWRFISMFRADAPSERLEVCGTHYLRGISFLIFRSWKIIADEWPLSESLKEAP